MSGQISSEVKELMTRLYRECDDTHGKSHSIDEGKRFIDQLVFCLQNKKKNSFASFESRKSIVLSISI